MCRRYGLAACLIVLPLVAGCYGSSPPADYRVTGKVLFQNQPLTKGSLAFSAAGHPLRFAAISPTGAYEARLPEGRYVVSVAASPEMPAGMTPMEEFAYVPEAPMIPNRYNDFQTSQLTLDVNPSDGNIQDFLLVR